MNPQIFYCQKEEGKYIHEIGTAPHKIIEDSGHSKLNFLSLDVEGYEYNVLQSINFNVLNGILTSTV